MMADEVWDSDELRSADVIVEFVPRSGRKTKESAVRLDAGGETIAAL